MTPQVKSVGRATMMAVVQKERPVPKIRTHESSRPQARTIGVSQNLMIGRGGGQGIGGGRGGGEEEEGEDVQTTSKALPWSLWS